MSYDGTVTITRPRPPKSRPRTNRERREESTLALLASAVELFGRQGYERTTAAEIGVNAGFSRNMVRDRYGSKEALLQAVFDMFAELLLPAARRERLGSGLDHALEQVDDLRRAVESDPDTMRAMIVLTFEAPGALHTFADLINDLIGTYQLELAGHITRGQADSSIHTERNAQRLAEEMVSYAIGVCFRFSLAPDTYDLAGELTAWRDRTAARLAG